MGVWGWGREWTKRVHAWMPLHAAQGAAIGMWGVVVGRGLNGYAPGCPFTLPRARPLLGVQLQSLSPSS